MELAVNMPEQEPQVGQAFWSTANTSASLTLSSAAITIESTKSRALPSCLPASMGPPDTKTTGMFRRMAAMSMPGVILSQLLMQIMASALWESEEHTSELQSRPHLVCRLLLEKKKDDEQREVKRVATF